VQFDAGESEDGCTACSGSSEVGRLGLRLDLSAEAAEVLRHLLRLPHQAWCIRRVPNPRESSTREGGIL
jgi:hypothetical protein